MILPRIGELKEVIDILDVRGPFDINSVGTQVSIFAGGIRAKIVPLGGDLLDSTQDTQTSCQDYNVWIRYRSGVTAFQQIAWGERRLQMTGPPEEISSRRWLLIHAEEVIDSKLSTTSG